MDKYKAKFIVLEGIDNTGKSTTAQKLKEHYESLGKKVKLYHEPYKFASFDVKQIIKELESEGNIVSDFAVLNLMIASREISIENILIPALKECDVVIADRYIYSTLAYQQDWLQVSNIRKAFWTGIELRDYPVADKVLVFYINEKNFYKYKNSKSDKFEIQDLNQFKGIQSYYTNCLNSDAVFKIEVDQNKQPYFDFNQVLQSLEGI